VGCFVGHDQHASISQIYERGDRVLHVGYLVDERPGKPRR
jgi:hypothetical protein